MARDPDYVHHAQAWDVIECTLSLPAVSVIVHVARGDHTAEEDGSPRFKIEQLPVIAVATLRTRNCEYRFRYIVNTREGPRTADDLPWADATLSKMASEAFTPEDESELIRNARQTWKMREEQIAKW